MKSQLESELARTIATLQAKNELLREALIASGKPDLYDGGFCFCDRHYDHAPHAEWCLEARQALAEPRPGADPVVTETPRKGARAHEH